MKQNEIERPEEHAVYEDGHIFPSNLSLHMLCVGTDHADVKLCVCKQKLSAWVWEGFGHPEECYLCKRQLSEMESGAACQPRWQISHSLPPLLLKSSYCRVGKMSR